MRTILLILIVFFMSACQASPDVKGKIANWQTLLTSEIPIGSTKDQVIQWGEKRGIKFTFLEQQQELYAIAEKIPDPSGIICTEWNITIQIGIGANGISTNQKVGSVGACI